MFGVVSILLVAVNCTHLYYSIDKASRYVSDAPSLTEITACKDQCMQMAKFYHGLHFRVNAALNLVPSAHPQTTNQ